MLRITYLLPTTYHQLLKMGDNYLKLSEFDIEGEFLGFADNDSKKFKYLQFALTKCNAITALTPGNLKIKLPKELRKALSGSLVPGAHIRVIGYSKLHTRTGEIKLKAYDVIPLRVCPINKSSLPTQPECSKKAKILVCQGSGCRKRGAKELLSKIEKTLSKTKLSQEQVSEVRSKVKIQSTGCLKKCSKAPNCIVQLGNKKFSQVKPTDIPSLIENHLE
ncbi:nucleic acid binding, OB-fold, tRNA/helicase-type [Calothrix sp. NIES-4071]|nr:nucleic acid binding, OB-fold, tRNA/helicase-type [Calothrix sp. NIES-4071]BAZ60509.1 nucleic acid binding, OB-fold, tRNA/helicase-type [Calothrix sp. NIES-4105]